MNSLDLINNTPLMYFFLIILSLLIGSLLNVIIYRLPIMLKNEWLNDCAELSGKPLPNQKKINLWYPRSYCPNCKTMIKAWQNIPVLSYLILRGRCSHCKAPISMRYPFIEFITMLLSLFAAWNFGFKLELVFILLAIYILICLIFIDLDHQLLPDGLTLGLLWLGLIANSFGLFTSLNNAVLSAAAGYLVLWVFIQLFYLITNKIGMGHGDFKLFAAFGAWFGWMYLPLILIIASFSGAVIGVVYLKLTSQSRDTQIPFGPFLCIAGLIAMFWGQAIINGYLSLWL